MDHAVVYPETIDELSEEWCLGKPAGEIVTVPPRYGKTRYGSAHYRCEADGRRYGKIFCAREDRTEEEAARMATEHGVAWSESNGLTTDMVRRLPDGVFWKEDARNTPPTKDTVEVRLGTRSSTKTMLVDFADLRLVQSTRVRLRDGVPAFVCVDAGGQSRARAVAERLHGAADATHRNRNPFDNRRCNLTNEPGS